MMNRNERMEKLNKAGINTDKYFTLNVNEAIPAGAKIHIVVDENGNYVPKVVDEIANQIIENGYVRNTKLHRRFVMAQMFQMLNYTSMFDGDKGYNAYLRRMYSYDYTLQMMLEEVRVLSKLEIKDEESFNERSHFFTKEVVIEVLCDYVEKLRDYIDQRPTKKCKGVPYKVVKRENIFVADLNKKIYRPLMSKIVYIKAARSYTTLYSLLKDFMRNVIKLPYDTPKSRAWIDAFKGEGAYYTLKNLVMFHDCGIITEPYNVVVRETDAVSYLNKKLDEYQGEGWRMFALMKKVIEDNNFDFNKRMQEIYNK